MASISFGVSNNSDAYLSKGYKYTNNLDFTFIEEYFTFLGILKSKRLDRSMVDENFDLDSVPDSGRFYWRIAVSKDELKALLGSIHEAQKMSSRDSTWEKSMIHLFPFLKNKSNLRDWLPKELWHSSEFIEKLLATNHDRYSYRDLDSHTHMSYYTIEEYVA
jgi:hypothetical protein